ncbi:MAG: DUF1579 domain-containing protein [Pseudomonadota bacterium]
MTNTNNDFAWQEGRWAVRHRKLRERLTGCQEWDEFLGSCTAWRVLGGQGNIEDNVMVTPAGTYRAIAVRAFDPASGSWSIWWLDGRWPGAMDVPVRGSFEEGVGTFLADDVFAGKPVKVRFVWSHITEGSARWEQAFSGDDGASWEVNWVMDFTRAG